MDARAKFILGKPENEGDILSAVKSAKPDAIMHFAASRPGRIHDQPEKSISTTTSSTRSSSLDAAVECGVKKFVFSSTCATYGPPDRVPMTEDLLQRPINPYGEAKLMFEKVLIWRRAASGPARRRGGGPAGVRRRRASRSRRGGDRARLDWRGRERRLCLPPHRPRRGAGGHARRCRGGVERGAQAR